MNKKHIAIGENYPEIVNVFVEMESGTSNKYEYDEVSDLIKLDRVFHSSLINPTDYGFIPQTIATDGDCLDILIISNKPTFPGCIVEAKIVGMLEVSDDNGPDPKIISVSAQDPMFDKIEELGDLETDILKRILDFVKKIKELDNNHLEIGEWKQKEEAMELIAEAHNAFMNIPENS
jgi:inorganic pyrophosphatase